VKIEVLADAAAVARKGAAFIAAAAHDAIEQRGRFVIAVSGGTTPRQMLRNLVAENIRWKNVDIVQVDERLAPAGSLDRNLTCLQQSLLDGVPMRPQQVHPMPVETRDAAAAIIAYVQKLQRLAGSPPILDLVQLGLGLDGHTASLVPRDPVLEMDKADVAVTGIYQGLRRMTLTFPIINRARCVFWIVTGAAKADVFARFTNGDITLPASRVDRSRSLVLVDRAAAARLPHTPA
jgi:6-phosphogluconolactonase